MLRGPWRSVRRYGLLGTRGLRKVLHSEVPIVAEQLRAHTMSDHIPPARTPHTPLMKIPTRHCRRLRIGKEKRKSDVSEIQRKSSLVHPHEFD